MPSKAMHYASDSQNPDAPLSCSANERPPVQFTPAGLVEMWMYKPTLAHAEKTGNEIHYYCPFCTAECSRDFCWNCTSELLDEQGE